MARRGIPWSGLAVVFTASLAGGWLLASSQRHARSAAHRHHAAARTASVRTIETPLPAPFARETPPRTLTTPALATSPAAPTAVAPEGASPLPSGAKLAIIIDDCGQWLQTERALIALPIPLTVSIMPKAPYGETVANEANASGQGIMLHLPMEPLSGVLAGDGEITTSMDDAQIQAQVRDDLRSVPLARGVNNHEGSKATADARVMRDVAEVLAAEGRYFVDSRTTAATVAAKETQALDIPTASRNVFLDNDPSVASVEAELERAAAIAKEKGAAIAIGHPKAATLAALRDDIPRLEREGVTFVLAQDLVQ